VARLVDQALLDAQGLLDALLDEAERLDQHRDGAHRRRHAHEVVGRLRVKVGHEAVQALDPALEVLAAEAHVLLALHAGAAALRAGPPHRRHHEVAAAERAAAGGFSTTPRFSWPRIR
jgi:hypothetical protein